MNTVFNDPVCSLVFHLYPLLQPLHGIVTGVLDISLYVTSFHFAFAIFCQVLILLPSYGSDRVFLCSVLCMYLPGIWRSVESYPYRLQILIFQVSVWVCLICDMFFIIKAFLYSAMLLIGPIYRRLCCGRSRNMKEILVLDDV